MMKFRLSPNLSETRGQSIVELALVLPLLVILALGVFDFSRAILANNIISNMSREGANLASRMPRTSITYQNIMNSLAYTAVPLTMDASGLMYITEVKNSGGVLTVQSQEPWSNNSAGPNSQIDAKNVAGSLQNLGMVNTTDGETIHVVEVIYTYQCLFVPYSHQLHSTTIL